MWTTICVSRLSTPPQLCTPRTVCIMHAFWLYAANLRRRTTAKRRWLDASVTGTEGARIRICNGRHLAMVIDLQSPLQYVARFSTTRSARPTHVCLAAAIQTI